MTFSANYYYACPAAVVRPNRLIRGLPSDFSVLTQIFYNKSPIITILYCW